MTNIQDILDKIGKSKIVNNRAVNAIRNSKKNKKQVFVFDYDGNLLETLKSAKQLVTKYGEGAHSRLLLKKPNKDGLFFSYENNYTCEKEFGKSGTKLKEIFVFNRSGNLIDTISGTINLTKKYGKGSYVCLQEMKSNKKGLFFSYENNFDCEKKQIGKKKQIFVFDSNCNLIDTILGTTSLIKKYGKGSYVCLQEMKCNRKGLFFSYENNFDCKKIL